MIPVIGAVHPHQQGAVGVGPAAGKGAHAVGGHHALLGSGGHHLAARAHAEGVHPPALGGVHAQPVLRRAQGRMPRRRAVLGPVDEALGMLDAQAQGKGLGRHGHALAVEGLEGVPGGVARGQNHAAAGDRFARRRHAGHRAALQHQALQPGVKQHLAAQVHHPLADGLDHPRQQVGADVGPGGIADFRRRAVVPQGLQHEAAPGIGDAGVQLAVGKSAGPALAKLHVALRVQRPRAPEALHLPRPLVHRCATLQHQGR